MDPTNVDKESVAEFESMLNAQKIPEALTMMEAQKRLANSASHKIAKILTTYDEDNEDETKAFTDAVQIWHYQNQNSKAKNTMDQMRAVQKTKAEDNRRRIVEAGAAAVAKRSRTADNGEPSTSEKPVAGPSEK